MYSRNELIISTTFFMLLIVSTPPTVNGLGFFEVDLLPQESVSTTVRLSNSRCCADESSDSSICPCQSILTRVCLLNDPFVGDASALNLHTDCVLGLGESSSSWSTAADRSSSSFSVDPLISIPFKFSWPGATTVVVQLLHRRKDGREVPIDRIVRPLRLNASSAWTGIGSASNVGFRARIRCDGSSYGPFCNIECTPQDGPFGHFECDVNGNRRCLAGWKNVVKRCTEAICAPGCKGGCDMPGECKNCPTGWRGPLCDECIPYPGCMHGTCKRPNDCICEERWGGKLCDMDLDYCHHKEPCRHGALCIPTAPNNYTCQCPSGFAGRDCEIEVNPCWSDPCLYFGTCVVKSELNYVCFCDRFHTGKNCENLLAGKGDVDPCHVGEQIYEHGQSWEMPGCRRCQCLDGSANCSRVSCQTDDCFLPTNRCPDGQRCSPAHPDPWSCVRGPCRARSYGMCLPNEFDEYTAAMKHASCNQTTATHCDHFALSTNASLLPVNTYSADICYHILVHIFERRFSSYHAVCSNDPKAAGVIRVQVVSLNDKWPVGDFKKILEETLIENHGSFLSPILRAITGVGEWTITDDEKRDESSTAGWTETAERILIASIVAVGSVICLLALAAYCLCRRMRSPPFRKSSSPPTGCDSESKFHPPPNSALVDVHLNNWTDRRKQCNLLAAACGRSATMAKEINIMIKPCPKQYRDGAAVDGAEDDHKRRHGGEKQQQCPKPDIVVDSEMAKPYQKVLGTNGFESSRRSTQDDGNYHDARTTVKSMEKTFVTLEASV